MGLIIDKIRANNKMIKNKNYIIYLLFHFSSVFTHYSFFKKLLFSNNYSELEIFLKNIQNFEEPLLYWLQVFFKFKKVKFNAISVSSSSNVNFFELISVIATYGFLKHQWNARKFIYIDINKKSHIFSAIEWIEDELKNTEFQNEQNIDKLFIQYMEENPAIFHQNKFIYLSKFSKKPSIISYIEKKLIQIEQKPQKYVKVL